MSDYTVARRYAQALYEEAEETGQVERVDRDIELIRESLAGSPELVRFFESPVIGREKKERVIGELFRSRLQKLTLEFLELLVEKQREGIFPTIVQAYHALRDTQLGIVEAQARVAQPLPEDEQEALRRSLERMTGKRVRLQIRHEPELIGGLVIRVGDTVYDGSVRHQLENLREQLEYGSYATNGT